MKELMKDLVSSMMDGLKDSRMYYDYAKEAKMDNHPELMQFFLERAKIRMKLMDEDYRKLVDLDKAVLDKSEYPYTQARWDCLHDYLIEEKSKLNFLITNFN